MVITGGLSHLTRLIFLLIPKHVSCDLINTEFIIISTCLKSIGADNIPFFPFSCDFHEVIKYDSKKNGFILCHKLDPDTTIFNCLSGLMTPIILSIKLVREPHVLISLC